MDMSYSHPTPTKTTRNSGFTLLELSIVLVIIGLIVGGITVGKEMIKASELSSVISDVKKFDVAVNTFNLKYNALPGDMDNATAYWGALADCDDARVGTLTCDGNGNGYMENTTGGTGPLLEWSVALQHLENSGLIQQRFPGQYAINGFIEDNMVPTALSGIYLTLGPGYEELAVSGYMEAALSDKGHVAVLGGWDGEDSLALDPLITPQDASSLDIKIDDGMPSTGIISTEIGFYNNTRCRNALTPPQYDYTDSTNTCALLWKMTF